MKRLTRRQHRDLRKAQVAVVKAVVQQSIHPTPLGVRVVVGICQRRHDMLRIEMQLEPRP